MNAHTWRTPARGLAVVFATLALISVVAPWMPWMTLGIGTLTESGLCVGSRVTDSGIPICQQVTLTGKELAGTSAQANNSLPSTFGVPTVTVLMLAFSSLGFTAMVLRLPFVGVLAPLLYQLSRDSASASSEFLTQATSGNAAVQTEIGTGATLMLSNNLALVSALAAIAVFVVSTGMWFAARADRIAAGEVRENKLRAMLTAFVAARIPAQNGTENN